MALKKTRPIADDNGNGAQRVFEHQIFKMLLPALAFILVGIVTWLFGTVLSLDETVQTHNVRIEHLHEEIETLDEKMEKVETTLTDVRVQVGRVIAH